MVIRTNRSGFKIDFVVSIKPSSFYGYARANCSSFKIDFVVSGKPKRFFMVIIGQTTQVLKFDFCYNFSTNVALVFALTSSNELPGMISIKVS